MCKSEKDSANLKKQDRIDDLARFWPTLSMIGSDASMLIAEDMVESQGGDYFETLVMFPLCCIALHRVGADRNTYCSAELKKRPRRMSQPWP